MRVNILLSAALTTVAALVLMQAVSAQQPEKKWGENEYPLYEAITKETQPAKKLDLLDQWKQKFPNSQYDDVRQQTYLQTYSDILTNGYKSTNAADRTLAVKIAGDTLANLDALFSHKPDAASDADWAAAKKSIQLKAQNMAGFVAMQQKDYPKAEAEFTKSLQAEPGQGDVAYWLATVVLQQRKPEKFTLGIFELARAANYEGPGALNPEGRAQMKTQFEQTYKLWHGTNEQMEDVVNLAKADALPKPDYKIKSKADIINEQNEAKARQEEEFRKNNPMLALWTSIKTQLTAADGQAYFDDKMKGAGLPGNVVPGVTEFKGKLIEATPALRPKELKLSIEDGKTADVTLKLDAALVGKMEPGSDIGFQGVASAFSASPFMVTFDVEKAKITGWKAAPPPPVHHTPARRPAAKSAAKK